MARVCVCVCVCANYKVLKIAHKRQSGWQKTTAAATATEHWPLDNEDEAKHKKAHRDLCHKKEKRQWKKEKLCSLAFRVRQSRPDARYVINYTSRCTGMAEKCCRNYNRKHNEIICTNGAHRNPGKAGRLIHAVSPSLLLLAAELLALMATCAVFN